MLESHGHTAAVAGTGTAAPADGADTDGHAVAVHTGSDVTGIQLSQELGTRLVREARRDTWFIVNNSGDDIATIPVSMRENASVRRAHVNGEVAEFSASPDAILVRPLRPLRKGAGTIVVIHYR